MMVRILFVSCGKYVFILSHDKCVARYALSIDSRVKRALFTSPVATKSSNLGVTSVIAKSRFSVAKTPTTTYKVSNALSLSPDSSQSRTLSNYMKNKIKTSRKWQKWFENQQSFNWSPKSKTAQSPPSMSKSSTSVIQLDLWIVDSGCSKHITGNLQLLRNFVEKFMRTFRFSNDHFTAITRYGDYDPVSTAQIFKIYQISVLSKADLDNLFGPLYEEYYATRNPKVSGNSTANTLENEDTASSSSIVVKEDEAPQIVTSSEEPIANEPITLVSNENGNGSIQEDIAEPDRNAFYNPFHTPVLEEAKSSLTFQNTSICTMKTTEPKNIKEAMLDHSWIESMQDELNQFKLHDVWERVKRPIDINIISFKWLWKNKIDAENTVIRNKSRLVAK
ncbi:hypothetical protein Tco_0103272 [Tanacetum coccineum]